MKNLIALSLVAVMATPSFAGTPVAPVMEIEPIAEEAANSSGDFVVPLMLLLVLLTIASSTNTDTVNPCFPSCV